MEKNESVFNTLYKIDCSNKVEKKNGLSYLSWAWAWAEVSKLYPNAYYTIYTSKTMVNGCENELNYFTDGKTCWVKTGVTIEGKELIEMLPVLDFKNKSIPVEEVTSFNVNSSIQRSLTKAIARHGLGLFVYAGEDLPEEVKKIPPITKEQLTLITANAQLIKDELAQLGIVKASDLKVINCEVASQLVKAIQEKKND